MTPEQWAAAYAREVEAALNAGEQPMSFADFKAYYAAAGTLPAPRPTPTPVERGGAGAEVPPPAPPPWSPPPPALPPALPPAPPAAPPPGGGAPPLTKGYENMGPTPGPMPTTPPQDGYHWELARDSQTGEYMWVEAVGGVKVAGGPTAGKADTPVGDPYWLDDAATGLSYETQLWQTYDKDGNPINQVEKRTATAPRPLPKKGALPPAKKTIKVLSDPMTGETITIDQPENYQVDPYTGEILIYDPSTGKYIGAGYYDIATVEKIKGEAAKPPLGVPPRKYPLPEGVTDTIQGNDGWQYKWNVNTGQHDIKVGGYDPSKDTGEAGREKDRAEREKERAAAAEREAARLAAEKEARLAGLAAQPISWFQHAIESKQRPAVQPFMLPLMPQEYAGLKVGAPIPGTESFIDRGPTGIPDMSKLPALTQPSTQYQARMGPISYQQYLGYEQARTGATPEGIDWRLWNLAPPSGKNLPITRTR